MPIVLAALLLLGQESLPSPGQPGSHAAFSREIRSSGERALQAALKTFDAYAREHPSDAVAAVERCKLIASETEREDEEADPRLPALEDCLTLLKTKFADSPIAVVYRLESTWGAKAVAFGQEALANPRIAFTDTQRARVWSKISQGQRAQGQLDAAGRSARRAMQLDPSLDLTSLLGEQLLKEGRRTEAIVALSSRPTGSPWELQQKARQLAEAGSFFRAQWMLDLASAGPGFHADRMLQGRVFEGTGRTQLAREAYAKQSGAWNKGEVALRLFKLELAGGDGAAAERAYQELRDQGWKSDPLARHRLALQWKAPWARWRARDLVGLAALLGCVAGFALLPFFAFLPLHAFTLWRRLRLPRNEEPQPRWHWWFRHVYLAGALLLVVQFVALYLFDYDELAIWIAPLQQPQAASTASAGFGLAYSLALAALLALLLGHRRERLRLLGPGAWTLGKCVGQAFVALFLGYCAALVGTLLAALLAKLPVAAISIDGMVRSMVQVYGVFVALFAVALLIPIAEEIIFRSILLDVFSRHLRFWVANGLQALLFAALHADPARLLFYLAMGLLAGRLRRAAGGLLPCILFHSANNAIALLMVTSMGATAIAPKQAPPPPDAELIACAKAATHGLKSSALSMNNLAWTVATDAASTRACLLKAEEAADAALRQLPEIGAYLDTKATVLFRQGRLDEAIDLERGAAMLAQSPTYFSQLDRFLRARQAGGGPLLLGNATPAATLSLGPPDAAGRRELVVELGSPFPQGLVLYARETRSRGLLRFAAGAIHERTYKFALERIRDDAQFEPALLDARGCDDCTAGWNWRYAPHTPAVDKYP